MQTKTSPIIKKLESIGIPLIPILLTILGCGLWPEMEILVPSFPDMKRVFNVSDAQIQELLSSNFFGFLLGVLIAGPLCDQLGRKKVLIYGTIGYLFFSFISPLVNSFHLLLGVRFLQGLFMTGPIVAGSVLLLEVTSGPRQVFWTTLSGSTITMCMAIAPLFGAYINNRLGYQGNLWTIFFLALVFVTPSVFIVPETLDPSIKKKIDFKSLWDNYFSLLKDKRFISLSLVIALLVAGYWIYVGVSALYMVDYLGVDKGSFGYYQGPIVGCYSIVSLFSAKIFKRFGMRTCLVIGCTSMLIGQISLLTYSSLVIKENPIYVTLMMMCFVGGMAPVTGILWPYTFKHLPSNLQGYAQSLLHGLRLTTATLGTTILTFVYTGPIMPVVLLMFSMLLISIIILIRSKSFL